ncbi:hypothetical protein CPLU01_06288 [Colletotrichum plurivorum]|uniref:Uncharacterized protein n=1 Tax=Colletotrichum plurivorum TaxID=2175906 RepID=A0A8H6NG52_9PEZI|nr:hypothetical protein CPLU01_06288 [Colletotrichum plurivorum]
MPFPGLFAGHDGFRGLKARRRSRWRIYLSILTGWTITLAIVLIMFTNLYFYSEMMEILSHETKRQVNTIVMALSLALSVTVLKGLNDFVATVRWWILSRRHHSLRKVDLILQAESVSRVILLAVKTRRLTVHLAACLWIILILMVQVALALLGLCFSIENQTALALVVQPGRVSVPDMSSIQTTKIIQNGPSSVAAQEYTANSYGQISLAFETDTTDRIPEIGGIWTPSDPLMFCNADHCKYIFHEKSVHLDTDGDSDIDYVDDDDGGDAGSLMVVATNRSLNSTATCRSWRVISGGDGAQDSISLETSGDGPRDVLLPVRGGIDQTTFMTNTSLSCGGGCAIVSAFEAAGPGQSWYYTCNVTVSRVDNGTLPEHEASAELRSMAAASIALQGSGVSSLDSDDIQYQVYPAESVFGLPVKGLNDSMAMLMARFAIGTVAICGQSNSPVVIDGFAPVKGFHLVVDHWDYIYMILVSIALGQFVLAVATAWIAGRIEIPEGGPIAMAQVLRPIAQRLKSSDKADTMLSSDGPGGMWIYKAVETVEKGVYDLLMEERVSGHSTDGVSIEMQ